MNRKLIRIPLLVLLGSALLTACDNDDAEPANDEELITTVRITLTPASGAPVVATWKDTDGPGATPPIISDIRLTPNTTYNASLEVLNESVTPAQDITEEIEEEAEEHQFFFQPSTGSGVTVAYDDKDAENRPVGLKTRFTTTTANTGTLRVTLRHEPNKAATGVANGDITNAGGETDVEVTFPLIVQ